MPQVGRLVCSGAVGLAAESDACRFDPLASMIGRLLLGPSDLLDFFVACLRASLGDAGTR